MTPQDEFNFDEFTAPSRLVYLAEALRIPVPKIILKLLPNGEIIGSIVSIGIHATALELNIPENQLMNVYEAGKGTDDTKASEHEFRLIIATMSQSSLDFDERLSITQKLEKQVTIAEFVNSKRNQLIEYEKSSLSKGSIEFDTLKIPTFNTGFQPLDVLTEGIAQTLITFMARPGTGKTSTFLTIMGELRKTNVCSSIWFFSLEMPLQMMMYRAKALLTSVDFVEDDRFFCGQYTPTDVLNLINDNPDPNRVIIYDSPDALGGGGDQRRFVLEEIFRDLVRIKTNSKCVLTASQPRRADGNNLHIGSVAESWQKAWYSDVIITIVDNGRNPSNGMNQLKMSTVKNRFGLSGRSVEYGYNYEDLSYTDTRASLESNGWDSPNELRDAVGDDANEW